tara:strand:+ start:155 stop:466 length:312 start_codon:yes stop_codon:yes gene_type:complete
MMALSPMKWKKKGGLPYIDECSSYVPSGAMVRHKLDSVNECARRGYNLRITCGGCNRVIEANAVLMMQELRGGSMALHKLEERAKWSECGHRGATVMPCEITF